MRIKTILLIAAIAVAPAPMLVAASQPPDDDDEQEATPCERTAIEIAEHATRFSEAANNTSDPFQRTDNQAKSCGVLLRGIKELREMSCPAEIVQLAVDAQKQAEETLDKLNEVYDYRFNCFVPDFL
jgi:hypothetical protein